MAVAAMAVAATTVVSAEEDHGLDAGTIAALRAIVGSEHVSTDEHDRTERARDKYSHHRGAVPEAVVFPGSTEEVSAVLRVLHERRIPVVAYGAGTSLEGHTNCPHGAVTLDMARMHAVVRLSVSDCDVTVQAGMRKDELNDLLRPHHLFFPVDPGPGASIGGMCATRCSGTNAVKYGTMRENVLSLTVVLADGRVVKTGQQARKSSAGYDLTRIFIGSEGTLGVITEVTLRLRVVPESSAVAVAAFPSVEAASLAVQRLMQQGVDVSCVELLDETMMKIIAEQSSLPYASRPTLFFKFAGTEAQVEDTLRRTRLVAEAQGASGWECTQDLLEQERIWQARKVALWSTQSAFPDFDVAITDVCVPVGQLARAVADTQADIAASVLAGRAPIVGHAGDGNYHVFLTFDPSKPAEVHAAEELNRRMVQRAINLGGTCSGEHGIGSGKREFLTWELSETALDVMRSLKRALDPHGILNPGKVLPDESPTTGALSPRMASGFVVRAGMADSPTAVGSGGCGCCS